MEPGPAAAQAEALGPGAATAQTVFEAPAAMEPPCAAAARPRVPTTPPRGPSGHAKAQAKADQVKAKAKALAAAFERMRPKWETHYAATYGCTFPFGEAEQKATLTVKAAPMSPRAQAAQCPNCSHVFQVSPANLFK